MAYLLGIDIGTSGTKTVLFNEEGKTIASSMCEYPLYQPHIGWAEQDPLDWWNAVCKTVKNVIEKSSVNTNDIKGVGLSGQMHGPVFLDKENNVLRNTILWCDQRSSAECEEITKKVGKKRLVEITANSALISFTASKVLWVMNNQPEIYEKTRKILLPKDYIRYMLTGEFATEVSDASGMQFLDVPKRKWSSEVLQKLGIDRSMLADVYESFEITGYISDEAAKKTGLKKGTPVSGGAGDQTAGAVGNGIVRTGIVSSTIGTSGVLFAHTDEVIIDKEGRVQTFCHAVPGKWHIMGVAQAGGLSLKWFRDNFCMEEVRTAELMDKNPYMLMDMQAEKARTGCEGLIYLPYLMGERTPHLNPYAKGVFFGISAKHIKRDFTRAVMEGVVYSLNDCMNIIYEMGLAVDEVRASGGGGKSSLWKQMQADVFKKEVKTINSSEGPALGVAILAGVGSGVYNSVEEACNSVIRVTEKRKPDEKAANFYSKYYEVYKKLYVSLKEQYTRIAEINNSISK